MLKIIIRAILLFILVFIPSISLAIEEDPLEYMDLNSLTEETFVEEKAKFLPGDYRDPITSARADARLPILLADGIFLLGPVTVEGVLIPKPNDMIYLRLRYSF